MFFPLAHCLLLEGIQEYERSLYDEKNYLLLPSQFHFSLVCPFKIHSPALHLSNFPTPTPSLPIFFLAPLTTPQPVKTGLEEYCQMFSKSSTSFYEHPSARCFYEDFQRQTKLVEMGHI